MQFMILLGVFFWVILPSLGPLDWAYLGSPIFFFVSSFSFCCQNLGVSEILVFLVIFGSFLDQCNPLIAMFACFFLAFL
jgi:hypothetical protein